MPVIVPTQADVPWYRQRTTLDGRDYVMSLRWNERNGNWYMDLHDQDDVPLAVGVKLVANNPLMRSYIDERLPPGMLMVVDMEGNGDVSGRDPGLCHMGVRFKLFYYSAAEVAAMLGSA